MDKKLFKQYRDYWTNLVKLEQEEEKKFHINEIYKLARKREKKQRAILNLKWKEIKNTDELSLFRFWRKENISTEIQIGDIIIILPIFFYKNLNENIEKFEEKLLNYPLWTVENIWKQFIDIWIQKPYPAWLKKEKVDIHLFVNDITFKRQIECLENIDKYNKETIQQIIESFFNKNYKFQNKINPNYEIVINWKLNQYQEEFVRSSIDFSHFILLHGPFWTWKTTTLTESIIQNYFQWKRILVSADSNTAVDNILIKLVNSWLFQKEDIVRIWPYTQIANIENISIYDQIQNHPQYKKIRQISDQINKLRKQQNQFTRPSPANKRWLSKEQIFSLEWKNKSYRWIKVKTINSMAWWLHLQDEINNLVEEKEKIKDQITNSIIDNAKIVLATNSMCFSNFLKDKNFDLAVIDEGSQASEPSCLLPIVLADKFIIAWDHKQLPPTVLSEKAKELEKSLFERLVNDIWWFKNDNKWYFLLEIQYRMNEKLMQFPNKMFYENKLKADESVKNIKLSDLVGEKTWNIISTDEVLYIIDVKWKQQKQENSLYNLEEIDKIEEILKELFSFWVKKEQIGIISPYSAQVGKLKNKLEKYEVEINSIDGFQWREKEIIIISWVRTENIGFLQDLRRLNVAITRSKRLLINIMNTENLKKEQIFKDYISFVKNIGKFIW
jgi:predicted DNA helicase